MRAARRRDQVELPPRPVPQVAGQLPLFVDDETAWWTERPTEEVNEAGGDRDPWDGGGEAE